MARRRRYRRVRIGAVGSSCTGVRWRCPSRSECYALPHREVLLRVECYSSGKCTGEAVTGQRRPISERARFKSMDEAKDWACSVSKRRRRW